MITLSGAALFDLLPHRPPVLLIDSVEIDPAARTAVGTKAVTLSEPCYWQCRSTNGLSYPVGLVMESLGQTCAALWLELRRRAGNDGMATLYFAKAENVSVVGTVSPGQTLVHTVTLTRTIADTAFMSGVSVAGGSEVLVAESLIAAGR